MMNDDGMNVQDDACVCAECVKARRAALDELLLAAERFAELVGRFDGRAAFCALVDEGDGLSQVFAVAHKALEADGSLGFLGWVGACGFLLKANDCVEKVMPDVVADGVALFIEKHMARASARAGAGAGAGASAGGAVGGDNN
ncbi:MAG: hypothetical protein RR888_09435 [Akkermansia sp.]